MKFQPRGALSGTVNFLFFSSLHQWAASLMGSIIHEGLKLPSLCVQVSGWSSCVLSGLRGQHDQEKQPEENAFGIFLLSKLKLWEGVRSSQGGKIQRKGGFLESRKKIPTAETRSHTQAAAPSPVSVGAHGAEAGDGTSKDRQASTATTAEGKLDTLFPFCCPCKPFCVALGRGRKLGRMGTSREI